MPAHTASRRVAITGAASGLGRALALRCAREGWQVALADIHHARLAEAAAAVTAAGGHAVTAHCDVRDEAQLAALVAQCEAAFGGLDLFVNNAGVAGAGPFAGIPAADWDWLLDINLMGVVRGCRAVLPLFRRQGSGHIVNIASMAGLLAPANMAHYNVAKTGVVALSESLHGELAAEGIRVTCVCPGFFPTNLGESLRAGDERSRKVFTRLLASAGLSADDVADAVFRAVQRGEFLCLPHARGRRAWWLKRLWYGGYLRDLVRIGAGYARRR